MLASCCSSKYTWIRRKYKQLSLNMCHVQPQRTKRRYRPSDRHPPYLHLRQELTLNRVFIYRPPFFSSSEPDRSRLTSPRGGEVGTSRHSRHCKTEHDPPHPQGGPRVREGGISCQIVKNPEYFRFTRFYSGIISGTAPRRRIHRAQLRAGVRVPLSPRWRSSRSRSRAARLWR